MNNSCNHVKAHLLISRAFRFPASPAPKPVVGWIYRRDRGAWVDADDPDRPMADDRALNAEDPKPRPKPKPDPMSKKADMETGEDMKGE